jgi:hypothetical protein
MTLIAFFNCVRRTSCVRATIKSIEAVDELTACTESQLRMMQDELTATFHVLDETITRLEREVAELRSENERLRLKINETPLPQTYSPSPLAQEILIRFCTLDTTVMLESSLLSAFPEGDVATRRAIAELCQHDFLAFAVTDATHCKTYIVTSKAKQLVFSTARRGRIDANTASK